MQKNFSAQTKPRDLAIDFLRAIALLLMVSIHSVRCVPDYTIWARLLKLIGESAPAFFFFAYGLTIHRLLKKDAPRQFEIIRLFLYVAIAQSFMAGQPFNLDFFLFLWIWQVILVLASRFIPKWKVVIPWIFGITIAALLVWSPEQVSDIFDLAGGMFPLLPWGLFILLGLVFGQGISALRNMYIACGLLATALGTLAIGHVFQVKRLMLIKSPMTITYCLLLSGVVLLCFWISKNYEGMIAKRKLVAGAVRFLSANLLLGTVLHYAAYLPVKAVILFIRRFSTETYLSFSQRFDFILILASALVACLLLWGWLVLTVRIYDVAEKTRFFTLLRKRFDLIAVLALAVVGAVTIFADWAEYVGLFQSVSLLLEKSVTLVIMTYLALELRRSRRKNLKEPK